MKNKFGPCGLLCEKCFAFENGAIQHHAKQLADSLGNFDNYAKRFETLLNEPKFAKYPDFKDFLLLLSSGNCKGCRKQQCHLFTACKVKQCYTEKAVDFCYECSSFPCNNTGFDENLHNRWLAINKKIREIGIDNYYKEVKDKPRY
ncbi:MAG: DUF3795 domain-containing protein [Bacteroidales bacterium]